MDFNECHLYSVCRYLKSWVNSYETEAIFAASKFDNQCRVDENFDMDECIRTAYTLQR